MNNTKYICPNCEGEKIQARAWVMINDYNHKPKFNQIELDIQTSDFEDKFYCLDCQMHITPNEEEM